MKSPSTQPNSEGEEEFSQKKRGTRRHQQTRIAQGPVVTCAENARSQAKEYSKKLNDRLLKKAVGYQQSCQLESQFDLNQRQAIGTAAPTL